MLAAQRDLDLPVAIQASRRQTSNALKLQTHIPQARTLLSYLTTAGYRVVPHDAGGLADAPS